MEIIEINKEGESKIILTVPKSCLVTAAKMTSMTEQALDVSVVISE